MGDIGRFQAAEGWFDVKQGAIGAGAVELRIVNRSDCVVADLRAGLLGRDGVDVDGDAEVDADFAYGVAKILEDIVTVAAGVDDHDVPATAENHFVEPEIIEVAAIGEIHVGIGFVGGAEGFVEEGKRRMNRSGAIPCARAVSGRDCRATIRV